MNDKTLYQKLLGLSSPWEVVSVTLDTEQEEVRVEILSNVVDERIRDQAATRSFEGEKAI